MRKEVDWKWQHSINLPLSYSLWDFQPNLCRPYPVRCLKLYSANTVFVIWNKEFFPNSDIVSELYEKNRETCVPRGKLKHSHWFFADAQNIARNCRVIWKYLWWWADSYRRLKYRRGCTIPLFQFIVWCEKCVASRQSRHYSVIGKQL